LNTTRIAYSITSYLSNTLNLDKDRTEIVQYAMDVLLSTTVNIFLTMCIAYILGVARYAFIVLIASASLRYFSGGGHCSSSGRCIVAGSLTIPLFGLAARKLSTIPFTASLSVVRVTYVIIVLLSSLSLFFWAPADTPNKPISTKQARSTLRRNSFICAAIIDTIVLYYLFKPSHALYLAEIYVVLIGITWQSFSLSPFGYTSIHQLDRLLQALRID